MNKGLYIVLEGPQGVGKTTQIERLAKEIQKYGYAVRLFREPDSQSHVSARAIREITQDPNYPLNTSAELLLYNAARALSLDVIRQSRQNGVICIADRNYLSTLAIQYYGRGDIKDYDAANNIISFAVGDMEPDLTLVLDASVEELTKRSTKRGKGERFDNLSLAFLDRVRSGYLIEAKKRSYPVIFADKGLSETFKNIWLHIAPLFSNTTLPKVLSAPSTPPPILQSNPVPLPSNGDQPLLAKNNNIYTVTQAGKDELAKIVSNTQDNVYAFTRNIDPVTVAAAMARLSRRSDDMRITLLDEFVGKKGKDEGLIQRVVTAYGDDSVQQLVGEHIVIENASILLTKYIEWGRLAAYLEQSTRYIYYDKKNSQGRYRYYTPTTLKATALAAYTATMDALFDNYSTVVHTISDYLNATDKTPQKERDTAWKSAIRAQACDAARSMLPIATQSTVGVFASAQALEGLIMRLMASESDEARTCGQKILHEARKVSPAFLERADKPDRGGATIAYRANTYNAVKNLANKLLPNDYGDSKNPLTLTDYYPKNELDLVPYMLYEHSSLSESELIAHAASMPYKDKTDVFAAYMGERLNRRHRPGRALERAWYSWDIVCDFGVFKDLQRHRIVNDQAWQKLTPRYGYDVPELVEKAGVADTFLDSFDKSLELYSLLQQEGFDTESQYATLQGHKMRWKLTMNAREAFHLIELRTTPQGHPAYRKLAKQMYDKIAEVHPIVSESMKFVNKDEDPELTRLAAERYTQYKLAKLDKKDSK